MLLQYMQISLCFRIISFLKKANKLWVSTPRVQPDFCKTLHGKHEEHLRSSLWKNTLLYRSSGKGDPVSPEKCALFSSELNVHCVVCRFPRLWRRRDAAALHHCADRVEVGVEAHGLPFCRLGVGVIHGVLKCCLAIVIFMNWTSCVLCFGCSPVNENISALIKHNIFELPLLADNVN